MEPTIKHKPGFTVAGLKYHGDNKQGEIPQLWNPFIKRVNEIPNIVNKELFYGVCGNYNTKKGVFDYVAGVEVNSTEKLPEGMETWTVPENDYVVFETTLPTINQTYNMIHNHWMPTSEFDLLEAPCFEFYDSDFCEGQKLTIWYPIKKK